MTDEVFKLASECGFRQQHDTIFEGNEAAVLLFHKIARERGARIMREKVLDVMRIYERSDDPIVRASVHIIINDILDIRPEEI